jgi:hypothetical protein
MGREFSVLLTIGTLKLVVDGRHFAAEPPSRDSPGEPESLEVNHVWLKVVVTEDLAPRHSTREVLVDIADLVYELAGNDPDENPFERRVFDRLALEADAARVDWEDSQRGGL